MTLTEFVHEHFGACWVLALILGLTALDVLGYILTRRKP